MSASIYILTRKLSATSEPNINEFHPPEGKLMLPHSYRISYTTTGTSSGSTGIEWTFNLTEFAANQKLADGTFDIDAK